MTTWLTGEPHLWAVTGKTLNATGAVGERTIRSSTHVF
jgi:hypothetical protein